MYVVLEQKKKKKKRKNLTKRYSRENKAGFPGLV